MKQERRNVRRRLIALQLENIQVEAANKIIEEGLSVRDAKKLAKSILNPKQSKLPITTIFHKLGIAKWEAIHS